MSMIEKEWPEAYRDRIKFMFNNDILSDVKFVVRSTQHGDCSDSKRSKTAIPVHKFLLSIRSPVFFAMFCGKLAETKENIDLPDCEYEGMLEFLRYIYTDEVSLTESNVMHVAYLAAKYMVPCLAKQCAIYLGRNLDSSNVFGVLKHARRFANEDLLKYCWDFIDQMTKDVLKSSEFLTIELSVLEELVERDTLNIREVELFKAVDCWAENECKRQNLKPDGSTKRRIIGDQIIKNIRFPVMKQSEFMEVVVDSDTLTQEETSNVIMKFLGAGVTLLDGFPETEREGSLLRCCRYDDFFYVTTDHNDPTDCYPVQLTVDKDIILHGISFWAEESELYATFSVTTNVYRGTINKDSLLISHTEMGDVERQCNLCCNYCGFDLLFNEAVALEKSVQYCIVVSFDFPDVSYYYGHDNVFTTICCGGVTFNFDYEGTVIAEFLFKVDD